MAQDTFRKVALVTGAASGIGRATAEAFVTAGYATALLDRDEKLGGATEIELRKMGECRFIPCDISDDASVKRSVDAVISTYGRLDAVFNGAGIDGETGAPTAECSMENWERVIKVNLTGTFSCMRYQIPALLASGGGSIVNCSSTAGLVGAPNLPAYIAAKHGIVGLTRAAALEYAKQGITINAVCPCMIDTPMSRQHLTPEVKDWMLGQSPIGKFGTPKDVASLVLWLCGKESNQFVTGQAIAIDGGWTAI